MEHASVWYLVGHADAPIRFTTLCQFLRPNVAQRGTALESGRRRTRSGALMRPLATIIALFIEVASTAAARAQAPSKPPAPRAAASDTALIGTYDLEVTTDDGTLT